MAVPYTFGSATTSIPLSQLDSNFATPITLGNTAVQLGNTITTLTGVTNVASGSSLTLGSNGNTTAITIDTSQNVGVGVTPSTWSLGKAVEINTVGQGVWATSSAAVIANNWYYNGAYKFAGTGYASRFTFSGQFQSLDVSNASGTAGNNITFSTVLATGYNQTVALQGGTQSAGTGIAFPATQSASSDANTLDDYEEGLFTPAFSFSSGSVTYSTQAGSYVKIGKFVQCIVAFGIASTSSPSGAVTITGMPFTAGSGEQFVGGFTIALARNFASALTLTGYIGQNSTTIQISKNASNAAFSPVQGTDLTASTQLYINIGYITA